MIVPTTEFVEVRMKLAGDSDALEEFARELLRLAAATRKRDARRA